MIQQGKFKKLIFWGILLVFPYLILGFIEMGLRLGGYGESYELTRKIHRNNRQYLQINRNYPGKYFRNRKWAPEFRDRVIPFKKGPHQKRLIVLGGSSAFGFPYTYTVSFPEMLEYMLNRNDSKSRWQVINLSSSAVNSFTLADIAGHLDPLAPDAVLIYAGHNEFYGAYGTASSINVFGGYYLKKLDIMMQNLRIYQFFQQIFGLYSNNELPTKGNLMSNVVSEKSIAINSPMYKETIVSLGRNLDNIAEKAMRNNLPVYVATPASNLRDQIPLHYLSTEKNRKIINMITRSRSRQSPERFTEIIANLSDRGKIDTALSAFVRASELDILGDHASARLYYEQARDLDQLRFRAPGDIGEMIFQKASEYGWHFISADSIFTEAAKDGIAGNDLFLEHLHPNAHGHFLLARAFYNTIIENSSPREGSGKLKFMDFDSFLSDYPLTDFELRSGDISIQKLMNSWPFRAGEKSFGFIPENTVDSISYEYSIGNMTWSGANLMLAEYFLKHGDPDEAIKIYQSVYLADPENLPILTELLAIYENQERFAEGVSFLNYLLRIRQYSTYYFYKGIFFYNQKQQGKAEQAFNTAVNQEKEKPLMSRKQLSDMYYYYASLLAMRGKYSEAIIQIEHYSTLYGGDDKRLQFLSEKIKSALDQAN